MKEKVVCFSGHRDDFRNIGIEEPLRKNIIELIEKGYTTFYDGGKGYFDKLSASIVIKLKQKYSYIKIIKILAYYNHDKEKGYISSDYDGTILPELEDCHPKQRITKRNEWIVQHSDVLVCHIQNTYKSGAYKTLKFARKINKPIIYI